MDRSGWCGSEESDRWAAGIDVTAGSYARGMARYAPEPDSPSLFDDAGPDGSGLVDDPARPLADRLRPRTLDDVVGQDHLLALDAPLGRMVASGRLSSIILWGPPGCGKTTVARLLADRTGLVFEQVSATFSGVADLPDGVERRLLYEPTANGHERRIRERLAHWEGLRARKR